MLLRAFFLGPADCAYRADACWYYVAHIFRNESVWALANVLKSSALIAILEYLACLGK